MPTLDAPSLAATGTRDDSSQRSATSPYPFTQLSLKGKSTMRKVNHPVIKAAAVVAAGLMILGMSMSVDVMKGYTYVKALIGFSLASDAEAGLPRGSQPK
jgi:hypothetical protein